MPRAGFLTGLACVLATASASAANLRTSDILERTAEATIACMQWQPVGLCFWLDCGVFGCRVSSSIKIAHYTPELG